MKFFKEKTDVINSFFIAENLTIDGNIIGFASGRIEGVIKGDVKINGKVIVSETGCIEGNLKCYDLILEGKINGDAVVHNSTSIGQYGILEGCLTSTSISIHENSKINGNINKLIIKNDGGVSSDAKLSQKTIINDKKETYW